MSTKTFASHADLEEKKVSFDQLSDHAYAYTAEGDPNTGIVIGDDAVHGDRHAGHAGDGAGRDPPHPRGHRQADQVRGAVALPRGARARRHRVTSPSTSSPATTRYDLIVERGEQDMKSEIERFPRLFRAVESVPGLDLADASSSRSRMTLWLGKLQVEIMQLGRGHTKGDTVVWLPQERILFSGDLVEYGATPYAGDAYFDGLAGDARRHRRAAPGEAGAGTRRRAADAGRGQGGPRRHARVRHGDVRVGEEGRRGGQGPAHGLQARPTPRSSPKFGHWVIFDHCLPFDVTRAYDEATQYQDPRIWTAERDKEMW